MQFSLQCCTAAAAAAVCTMQCECSSRQHWNRQSMSWLSSSWRVANSGLTDEKVHCSWPARLRQRDLTWCEEAIGVAWAIKCQSRTDFSRLALGHTRRDSGQHEKAWRSCLLDAWWRETVTRVNCKRAADYCSSQPAKPAQGPQV